MKRFLLSVSLFSTIAMGSVQASCQNPSISFLPSGDMCTLTKGDQLAYTISLMSVLGAQKENWHFNSSLDLDDIRISPDEQSFVGVEESGHVRTFTRDDFDIPRAMGKILYAPRPYDLNIRVLGYSAQDRILLSIVRPSTNPDEIDLFYQRRGVLMHQHEILTQNLNDACQVLFEIEDRLNAYFASFNEEFEKDEAEIDAMQGVATDEVLAERQGALQEKMTVFTQTVEQFNTEIEAQRKELFVRQRAVDDAITELSNINKEEEMASALRSTAQTLTHLLEIDAVTGTPMRSLDLPGKITHAAICENGEILVDDRHPIQKHINRMWQVNLETGQATPLRTYGGSDAPASELTAHKLSAQGNKGYFLSYAGKGNTHSRILRYDVESKTFGVAFAATPEGDAAYEGQDVVAFGLAKKAPMGFALLAGQNGSAQHLMVLKNQDGALIQDRASTVRVQGALGERHIECVKISPMGDHVIVSSLDTEVPGWATCKDLISLETGEALSLERKVHNMPQTQVQTLSTTIDGVTTYSHLYIPLSGNTKMPLLVSLHGGPHSHDTVGYDASLEAMLNHGYAVADVNYRGSTGRGKVFHNLIEGDQGGGEVDDVAASIHTILLNNPDLDGENVFVLGHSYGAYLATMLGMKHPGLAKGLIALGGIYDWSQKEGHPSHLVDASRVDSQELDMRMRPVAHADKIASPMLIIHGWKDNICSPQGAYDLAHNMHKAGKDVSSLTLDTDHFFKEEDIQQKTMARVLDFVENLRSGVVSNRAPYVYTPIKDASLADAPAFDL